MEYFQIAGIGFCIQVPGKPFLAGKYLQSFEASKDSYELMEDRIMVCVEEKSPEIPVGHSNTNGQIVWVDQGRSFLAASYGHCRGAAAFAVSDWSGPEIRIQMSPELYQEKSFSLNQLLAITGLHSPLLARGALTIHVSYVAIGKGSVRYAILFMGPSGMGKSTQAELWRRYAGAQIINGDRAVIRYSENCWKAYGVPVCGSSQICENVSLPIAMIVMLNQGKDNHIEEITAGEVYRRLLLATAFYQWDAYESRRVHELIMQVIDEVPVIQLICCPDEGAVRILQNYIEQIIAGQERNEKETGA